LCYFLSIASPLTLSEIRAMLPAGLSAHTAPTAERDTLIRLHPAARTVAHLLVGSCSCDLVRPRLQNSIEDEREHRSRYQRAHLSRAEIIRLLERHRRGPDPRPKPDEGWPSALNGFVREHARNAGPTLYLLTFDPPHHPPGPSRPVPVHRSVNDLGGGLDWLAEDQPVLVS